jgi:hypothetical protein
MIAGERPRRALVLCAISAVTLAAGAFLPWYGPSAIAARAAAGPARGVPTAVQVILLVLSALALLDALLGLARAPGAAPASAGASVAVLAMLGAGCVAYGMLERPAPAGMASAGLREGAWLALISALAMIVGGLWPRRELVSSPSERPLRAGLGGLPGATPGA